MSGKGSARRPHSVDTQTYAHRWEATFRAPAAEPADDDGDGGLILYDGLESARIGTAYRCGMDGCAVYDFEKLLSLFVTRDGMTEEEAGECIDFNIGGGYVGERTPFILYTHELDDDAAD